MKFSTNKKNLYLFLILLSHSFFCFVLWFCTFVLLYFPCLHSVVLTSSRCTFKGIFSQRILVTVDSHYLDYLISRTCHYLKKIIRCLVHLGLYQSKKLSVSWISISRIFESLVMWIYSWGYSISAVIVKIQNICNLIGWNRVHISDIFNCFSANTNGMWNKRKLGGIHKTFEFILT